MRARHPQWTNLRLARYFDVPVTELENLFPAIPRNTPAALARHGQSGVKMQQQNALAALADEIDLPLTRLQTIRAKWLAGKTPVSDRERTAFDAFDAAPEAYGRRPQAGAALPADLTDRGPDSFASNRPPTPRGSVR